jgi:hypothetical protein
MVVSVSYFHRFIRADVKNVGGSYVFKRDRVDSAKTRFDYGIAHGL